MRKAAIALALFVVSVTSAFAGIEDFSGDSSAYLYPGLSDRPFAYKDNRLERLGGTGTALSVGVSSLYYNPANLAEMRSLMLNVPSLNISLYNAGKLLRIDGVKEIISDAVSGREIEADQLFSVMRSILLEYGYGIFPLAELQADVGFSVAGFGFDALVSGDATLYNMTGQMADARIVPSFSAGAALGYAYKFKVSDKISISAGLSVSLFIRTFMAGIGLSDLNEEISLDIIKNRTAGTALQFPINIGVTATFLDSLKASVAVRNISFVSAKVYSYGTFNDFLANPFKVFSGQGDSASASYLTPLGKGGFSASVDVGLAYNPKLDGLFNPRVEIDFVDLLSFSKGEHYDYSNFFAHLKIGAELFLLKFLKVGAGLNQGRISFGATLDLWPVVIDVDYGWVDATPVLGEAMTDRLSVNVKLGWDRSK